MEDGGQRHYQAQRKWHALGDILCNTEKLTRELCFKGGPKGYIIYQSNMKDTVEFCLFLGYGKPKEIVASTLKTKISCIIH